MKEVLIWQVLFVGSKQEKKKLTLKNVQEYCSDIKMMVLSESFLKLKFNHIFTAYLLKIFKILY